MKDRIEYGFLGALIGAIFGSIAWIIFGDVELFSHWKFTDWIFWWAIACFISGFFGKSRFTDASVDAFGKALSAATKTEGMPFGLPAPWLAAILPLAVVFGIFLFMAASS